MAWGVSLALVLMKLKVVIVVTAQIVVTRVTLQTLLTVPVVHWQHYINGGTDETDITDGDILRPSVE